MSLADYKGPSNCSDIFRYLVGMKITATFQTEAAEGTNTYIVDESGNAIVFNSKHGSYWKESKADVAKVVERRRREIEAKLAELRDLPGVELP